jgi:hypothetical protein
MGYGLIGLLLIMMSVLALVSMRKENHSDEPLSGLFWLTLVVLGLCTFVALSSAYQSARSVQRRAPRLQSQFVELR